METSDPLETIIQQNILIDILQKKEQDLLKMLTALHDINQEYRNYIANLERKLSKT